MISGLAKCIDPAGTAIKLTEYLQYFGMGMMVEMTMALSCVLCLVEFFCGISLLIGRMRVWSLILSTMMMAVFTPLTAWLAWSNAIDDCGCFGDLIHLSNDATFAKNLVLDAMLVTLWCCRHLTYSLEGKRWFILFKRCAMVGMVVLCLRGILGEPFVDFRPFRPGVNLVETSLGSVVQDSVWYTFTYSLDGRTEEFDIDNLPDESAGWEFVETIEHHETGNESRAGEEHIDFFVLDADGNVVTEELLRYEGYTLLLLSASLDDASQHDIDRIEKLYEYAQDNGYPFYCITQRDSRQHEQWCYNTGAEYPFLFTDVTIVETICRSNPCVMLLNSGVICWKKPIAELDTEVVTSAKLNEQTSGEIEENNEDIRFLVLLFLLFAPFVVYLLVKIPHFVNYQSTKKDSKDA